MRDGGILRVFWSLSLCITMRRLFVACQVVVNAFHLSTYFRFQRCNMCFRFQFPGSLQRADDMQRKNVRLQVSYISFISSLSNIHFQLFCSLYSSECNLECMIALHFAFVIRELPLMSGDLAVKRYCLVHVYKLLETTGRTRDDYVIGAKQPKGDIRRNTLERKYM